VWPFTTRLCRCGHTRGVHKPEWGWTACVSPTCKCPQFRWVRAVRYWDWRYKRAERFGWRRG
jgi:hypothetical protein